MDNNKPYNEFDAQFNDLPLPDSEAAWQKMKELLDEEDDRKPVTPLFLKSCIGWGLSLLVTGAIAWFVVKPERWWQSNGPSPDQNTIARESASPENSQEKPVNEQQSGTNTYSSSDVVVKNDVIEKQSIPNQEFSTSDANESIVTASSSETDNSGRKSEGFDNVSDQTSTKSNAGTISKNDISSKDVTRQQSGNTKSGETLAKNSADGQEIVKQNKTDITDDNEQQANVSVTDYGNDKVATSDSKAGENGSNDTEVKKLAPTSNHYENSVDSVAKSDTAAIKLNAVDSAATAQVVPKPAPKQTAWVFSAGVGLQQQIPIGHQKAVPYDYYGRKSSIYDYIPSVYARLERNKKWYVQGEFRYGAPQSLREFSYSRQTRLDVSNSTISTTTFRLKKTYYHQLPVSFNYYILPNWSVGAGGMFSRFYGAVTEKEVRNTHIHTQVETVSREIVNVRHFTDSFLFKTQLHVLFQTEYHWNRFTFGLRYTKDAQPFIKYTQPDGTVNVKRNQTLQALVRFRVFQAPSEAKRKGFRK